MCGRPMDWLMPTMAFGSGTSLGTLNAARSALTFSINVAMASFSSPSDSTDVGGASILGHVAGVPVKNSVWGDKDLATADPVS